MSEFRLTESPPDRVASIRQALLWGVAILQIAVLWGTNVPLGIPGEWEWPRLEYSSELWAGLPLLLPLAVVYALVVMRGYDCFAQRTARWRACWLCGLMLLGMLWLGLAWSLLPGTQGWQRGPIVLYLHQTEGYFLQAREIEDVHTFLQGYPERISDPSQPENYLHLGTHPPGLTLAYRGLLTLCEQSPALRSLVLSCQSPEVRDVWPVLTGLQRGDFTEADAACLWLATWLTVFVTVATVIPLYVIGRLTSSPPEAWLMASLWPLVPSLLVFLPKSDLLYPVIVVGAQAGWLLALREGRWWGGLCSGLLMWLGMWLSLAMVPVGAAMVIQATATWFTCRTTATPVVRLRVLSTLALGALAFCGLTGVTYLSGVNLPHIWLLNYRNHGEFYSHATRTYAWWLGANVLELAFALGLPLSVWIVLNLRRQTWSVQRLTESGAVLLIWLLLWLTGKNMGEAARLWCVLMPFAVWASAADQQTPYRHSHRTLYTLLAAQMLIAVLTAARVKGLDFG